MGKDLEHNVFDPSLWSELFTRVKFDSSQKEGYREDLRPALNWGLQIAFLKEKAMQSKWMVENMEVVYPDHVLDHDGKIKESPTHVIVPGLIPGLEDQDVFFFRTGWFVGNVASSKYI